jgi:hypothetical protein
MRDMTLSPLAIQLGIAAILVLSIAVSTLSFALTSRKAGAAPTIRATSRKLKPGWYQLQIVVTNRAPYGVVVDELRRVRPRAARLMAPIQQVSTREGDFQVWSDPTTDKARIGIPLDIALAPNDGGGRVLPAKGVQLTAWLFLPAGADPSELCSSLRSSTAAITCALIVSLSRPIRKMSPSMTTPLAGHEPARRERGWRTEKRKPKVPRSLARPRRALSARQSRTSCRHRALLFVAGQTGRSASS